MSLYQWCNYSGGVFLLHPPPSISLPTAPQLHNKSLRLPLVPEQSINGSTVFLGNEVAGGPPSLHLQSVRQICPSPSKREEELSKRKKREEERARTRSNSVLLHQNRNSLAWNINLPRKRHRESETSSNLMQEKTAIWLGREFKERRGERPLPSPSLYQPSTSILSLPPSVNADH